MIRIVDNNFIGCDQFLRVTVWPLFFNLLNFTIPIYYNDVRAYHHYIIMKIQKCTSV